MKNRINPSTEYWLNRILRDHASQIFIFGLTFLLIVLASIISSIYKESNQSNRPVNSSTINVINRSNTTIDGLTTTTHESVLIQNDEIISSSSGKTVKMKNGTIEIINQ